MRDWNRIVAAIVDAHARIAAMGMPGTDSPSMPRPPAAPAALAQLRTWSGAQLAGDYLDFLAVADGWPGIWLSLDLYGTAELQDGSAPATLDREDVAFVMAGTTVPRHWQIPIATARHDLDVWMMISPDAGALGGGSVIWMSHAEEIKTYPSFGECLEDMIAINLKSAEHLGRKVGGGG
jgi:hypothetical protein